MNKEETVHFTITVPKSLKAQMNGFQEINWSGVVQERSENRLKHKQSYASLLRMASLTKMQ